MFVPGGPGSEVRGEGEREGERQSIETAKKQQKKANREGKFGGI